MDTKLKADIAEYAVTTELLRKGYNVLRPVGDRLSYDLAVDVQGRLVRVQVKSAWFNQRDQAYVVDVRRTKTNRRRMIRKRYLDHDFDLAIVYLEACNVFYIIPVTIFNGFGSSITFVEEKKRQRPPRSAAYRQRWDLININDGAD